MDLAGNILRLCDGIADIFIPRACPACGCAMDNSEEAICGACLLALHRAGIAVPGSKLMDTIANGPAPAGIAASWLRYRHDSPEARLIQSIKYLLLCKSKRFCILIRSSCHNFQIIQI